MTDDDSTEKHYSLEELSAATGFSRRTIRFYMQLGLVPKPVGVNRGAYYTPRHIERLLAIRRMRNEGISLKRVCQELSDSPAITGADSRGFVPDPTISVKVHISVASGVELVIDSEDSGFGISMARELALKISALISEMNDPAKP